MLAPAVVERFYRRANASRWELEVGVFAEALERSVLKAAGPEATPSEAERHLQSLHLEDLALACACSSGQDAAWQHFMLTQRSGLYRGADAIDRTGGARELADALYADLYGISERDGRRQSLFRYYHGRSTLATWLRAVLAQRHVDRVRQARRLEPLPREESPAAVEARTPIVDPERTVHVSRLTRALANALSRLVARDRLRLGCYYAQEMTLAETGRALKEHEATVSRHLAKTRRALRDAIEEYLRTEEHLTPEQISQCLGSLMDDAGPIDLSELLATSGDRKKFVPSRSTGKRSG